MHLKAPIRNSFILMLVGICFEVKKKQSILQIPYIRSWSQGKVKKKKMYNFLKLQVNFKKTVLVIVDRVT
jgi:hypothetical protein